jgi:hypothetical protein
MNNPYDNLTDCTATFDLTGGLMVNEKSHKPPTTNVLLGSLFTAAVLMLSLLSRIASQRERVKASPFRRRLDA